MLRSIEIPNHFPWVGWGVREVLVSDTVIGRFNNEHSLGIWDPNEFIFPVPHGERNAQNGKDISQVKQLFDHGFLPSMSFIFDKLISYNGELGEGLYSRPGPEVLNPWDPQVHPYVNRGSIAYEIASTLMTIFLFFPITFQIGEAILDGFLRSQSDLTLYLEQRICMHKLSLLEAIIHASLASKALLKSFAF